MQLISVSPPSAEVWDLQFRKGYKNPVDKLISRLCYGLVRLRS